VLALALLALIIGREAPAAQLFRFRETRTLRA
jgi:hypothetical protein